MGSGETFVFSCFFALRCMFSKMAPGGSREAPGRPRGGPGEAPETIFGTFWGQFSDVFWSRFKTQLCLEFLTSNGFNGVKFGYLDVYICYRISLDVSW